MFSKYAQRLNRGRRHGQTDGSGAEPLRHTYDPESETHRYQYTPPTRHKAERPHPLHVLVRVVEILLALALAGLTAHTIYIYNTTKSGTMRYPHGNTLSAWPVGGAALGPSYVLIAAAVWTVVYNFLALIAGIGFLNKLRTGFCGRFAYFVFFALTIAIWVAALLYDKIAPHSTVRKTDLFNWACEHKDYELVTNRDVIGLTQVCTEGYIAWVFGIAIGALEIFNFVSMIFGVCSGHTRRRATMATVAPFQPNPYRKLDANAGQDYPMMENRGQMS